MLTQNDIKWLAALAKLKPEDLTAAITDAAEKSLNGNAELQVFTPEEIQSRDTQQQNIGHKAGFSEGKGAGKEIATKAIKQKFSIEGDEKDLDRVLDAAHGFVGKDGALKEQVTLLQQSLATKDSEIASIRAAREQAETNMRRISQLHPDISGDFSADEHLFFVNNKLKFTENGTEFEGKVLRHEKTQEPLSEKDAVHWLYENKLSHLLRKDAGGGAAKGGGRGAGNSGKTGGITADSYEGWVEKWQSENPGLHPTSPEGQAAFRAAVKENPKLAD